jgi:hypothetical protein
MLLEKDSYLILVCLSVCYLFVSCHNQQCNPKRRSTVVWHTFEIRRHDLDMRLFTFSCNDGFTLLNVDLYDKQLMKCTYLKRLMLPSQTERSENNTRCKVIYFQCK